MDNTVKPCPYCGVKTSLLLVDSWGPPLIYEIECYNPNCDVKPVIWSYDEKATLEMWNAIPERKENVN